MIDAELAQAIVARAFDGVFVMDAGGAYLAANPRACELLGCTHEELLTLSVRDVIDGDDRDDLPRRLEALRAGEVVVSRRRLRRRDGQHLEVELTARMLPDGRVFSIVRDVGAQRETEAALRAARDRLQAMLRATPDMVFLHAADGRTLDVNDNVVRTFGWSREEMIEGGLPRIMDAPRVEKARSLVAAALAGETPAFEWTARTRRGEAIAVEVRLMRVDAPGDEAQVLAIVRDVTDRKALTDRLMQHASELEDSVRRRTAELKDANAQLLSEVESRRSAEADLLLRAADLERSNRDLEQFASVASHDLKEPLRMISGFSELLAEDLGDDLTPAQRQYVDHITGGVRRMERLVTDLLQYARAGAGDAPAVVVDPRRALDLALSSFEARLVALGGEIHTGALPPILGDEADLARVFQNLVDNAIKFRGERPPVLRVSAAARGGVVEFTVRDHGVGIDPRYAGHIFEMFKRLNADVSIPGSGIGLAICKKLVERQGGRIWWSEPADDGPGACFHFSLPAATI